MIYLLKDYETRSRIDLAAAGQAPYAKDESTDILCMGYKIIGEKQNRLISYQGIYTDDPSETKEYYYAIKHADFIVAHNAPFEQAITNHTLLKTTPMGQKLKYIPPEKFICTMAGAGVMGLPRKLEKVAEALSLPFKKDTEGRRLMLSMCKPKSNINRKTDVASWLEWVETDDKLQRLYEYCKTDLDVEESLFKFLGSYSPWTLDERDTWVLDQVINQRGFKVDFDFVMAARDLLLSNEKILNQQLLEKTLYTVRTAKSTKSLKAFITNQGHEVENVQKKTVAKLLHELRTLNHERDKELIEVLEIREQLGLSSTSKYESFYQRTDRKDLRVRDNLIYHGAATGRWAGTGVQPQNFPRGTVKVKEEFFSDFKHVAEVTGVTDKKIFKLNTYQDATDLFDLDDEETVELEVKEDVPMSHADYARIYHPNLTPTLSSMLRGCIVSEEGKYLFVGDFSSIEARVLLWCARDLAGLKEYEAGVDAYCAMAAVVYKRPYKEILDEYMLNGYSDERQVGKKVILACFERGTKVLTDKGFICISKVNRSHMLWDGVEWVRNEGVIYRGMRKTINFHGVKMTPDHLILTPSGWTRASSVLVRGMKYLKPILELSNLPKELSVMSLIAKLKVKASGIFKLAPNPEKLSKVYDVLNAGSRNRFTVMTSKGLVVVHNCGYQMGLKKFSSTLEDDGIFLKPSVIEAAHQAFRVKHPNVPKLWTDTEKAAIGAVLNVGKAYTAGKCTYVMKRDFLTCVLPSGRKLWYYRPEVVREPTPWGELRYKLYTYGTNSKTKQWQRSAKYGGLLVENNVQAISRDCMVNGMKLLEAAKYEVLLTVHDEVITEKASGTIEEFKTLMSSRPTWGTEIPLKVGAWQAKRYKK